MKRKTLSASLAGLLARFGGILSTAQKAYCVQNWNLNWLLFSMPCINGMFTFLLRLMAKWKDVLDVEGKKSTSFARSLPLHFVLVLTLVRSIIARRRVLEPNATAILTIMRMLGRRRCVVYPRIELLVKMMYFYYRNIVAPSWKSLARASERPSGIHKVLIIFTRHIESNWIELSRGTESPVQHQFICASPASNEIKIC